MKTIEAETPVHFAVPSLPPGARQEILSQPAAPLRRRIGQIATSRWLLASISIGMVLMLWWQISYWQWVAEILLPAPLSVLNALVELFQNGYLDVSLCRHLAVSLQRILLALLLAIATAIPCGFVLGLSPVGRGLLDPLLELYRPIPPLAWLPLMIIWFGIGELSKVLLIYLSVFAPLAMTVAGGVRRVQRSQLHALRALGASKAQLLRHVIFPASLPDILSGVRIASGLGWSTLVAAELVAASEGVGFMLYAASRFMMTDVVISGIILIAMTALLMDLALRRLQAVLTPWQKSLV